MGSVTYYVALAFMRNAEGGIVAGEARQCLTAVSAISVARQFANTSIGAVAFSRTGDQATGEFAEAVVLEKFGEILSLDDFVDANV